MECEPFYPNAPLHGGHNEDGSRCKTSWAECARCHVMQRNDLHNRTMWAEHNASPGPFTWLRQQAYCEVCYLLMVSIMKADIDLRRINDNLLALVDDCTH